MATRVSDIVIRLESHKHRTHTSLQHRLKYMLQGEINQLNEQADQKVERHGEDANGQTSTAQGVSQLLT